MAGTLAARITVTAGLSVIIGEMTAALARPGWAALIFGVTASTASFAFWRLSGLIVPPSK